MVIRPLRTSRSLRSPDESGRAAAREWRLGARLPACQRAPFHKTTQTGLYCMRSLNRESEMTAPAVRFETLIERYHHEIYSYLWRVLNSSGGPEPALEAQDLAQEVYLRAYRAFGRLRQDSNHRAWLYRIATNCAYTALKQGQRQGQQRVDLPDGSDGTDRIAASKSQSLEQQVIAGERRDRLRREIATLPPKQQAAVVMRHLQGLDYAEIALALDCSQDSARANVYQGLRRLRQSLTGELG